jgi:tRNA G37 N-methylase TrmD
MRIDIVTVLPELLRSPFEASIMKRAIDKGLVVHFHNLRTTQLTDKVLTITLMVVVLEW